ncbi:hypothetical protein [Lunatibacter salilacus]|nr:hypothetical protein [Lunatibacter salilacus]
MPRHKDGEVLYSILRNEEGMVEKNPMIVLYRLNTTLSNDNNVSEE